MERRTFLATSAAAALARPGLAAPRRPNILLIMADDLGYRELGCYGQQKIRTPHLDRLATQGMKLHRFYSASPVCAPTRCCLMTGQHTGHAAIRGNKEVGGWGPEDPEGQWPLATGEVTIAELLKKQGYATGAFGKWGLGGPGSVGHPCRQGFDHFYGYLCQRVAHNHYPTHLWRNFDVDIQTGNRYFAAHQKLTEAPSDPAAYEQYRGEDYAPAAMLEEAEGWLKARGDEPWFCYFPSTIPHVALQAPQEWIDQYPQEWDPEPYLGQQGYLPTPRPRATYAAMISYLDHSVGRLLETVAAMGQTDHTLVIFCSDNGTTFNGGCDREFFDSLGELRGYKTNVYEGGIRVPCIAAWPGRIPAGTETARPAASYDLLPTLADAAGVDVPAEVDGRSMMPTLLGERQPDPEFLYFEYPERGGQQAVMSGVWKAVRPTLKQDPSKIELYRLTDDPGEQHDLAAERPEVVSRMERLLTEQHVPSADFPLSGIDR